MTDAELLDLSTRVVLSDQATAGDLMACERSGLGLVRACSDLYGWADPLEVAGRGAMNAVQFVQALHLARRMGDAGGTSPKATR